MLQSDETQSRAVVLDRLRPWLAARKCLSKDADAMACVDFILLVAETLADDGAKIRRFVGRMYVAWSDWAATRVVTKVVASLRFTQMVPASMQALVVLLSAFPSTYKRVVPHKLCTLSPKDFRAATSALRVEHYLRLILALPAHVPGLALEEEFALAVYDSKDVHCLHQALVFSMGNDWSLAWRWMQWPVGRETQRRLFKLAGDDDAGRWEIPKAHLTSLLCSCF